jgi:mannose-6-phosphate isomerase
MLKTMRLSSLNDVLEHSKTWLFGHAAPLWSTEGVHDDGMFAERIAQDGKAVTMNRRLRVQARQVYSFCTIGRMGWDGDWRGVATNALNVLLEKGFRPDGQCVHLFSPQGDVINSSIDLYDHAFMLFALGHAAGALDRSDAYDRAVALRDIMLERWLRPEGGFYEGELTPCPPYRQNPHMHMFEAALVNYQFSGDAVWLDLLTRLGTLFQSRFADPATGAVTEYFDKSWTPLAAGEGDIVEPGHCLEWAWLFEVAPEGVRSEEVADRLTTFARSRGVSAEHDVAINEVYLDGRIRDAGARLWPQTERLKAAVARYRRLGTGDEAAEIVRAYRGLWLYLDVPVPGLWRDRLEQDGSWVDEAAPASSFYHIVCALHELASLGKSE